MIDGLRKRVEKRREGRVVGTDVDLEVFEVENHGLHFVLDGNARRPFVQPHVAHLLGRFVDEAEPDSREIHVDRHADVLEERENRGRAGSREIGGENGENGGESFLGGLNEH